MKSLLIPVLTAVLAVVPCSQGRAAGCGGYPRTVQLVSGQTLSFPLSEANGCTLSLLYRVPRRGALSGCAVLKTEYTFSQADSAPLVVDIMQDQVCYAHGDKAYIFPRGRRPFKVSLTSLKGEVEVIFTEKTLP